MASLEPTSSRGAAEGRQRSKSERAQAASPRMPRDADKFRSVSGTPVNDIRVLMATECGRCDTLRHEKEALQNTVSDLRARIDYLETQLKATQEEEEEEAAEKSLTSLGPIGLMPGVYPKHGLQVRVHDSGMYELLGPADKLQFLQKLDLQPLGSCSARTPVTLDKRLLRSISGDTLPSTFCFLYPLVGTERALRDPSVSRLVDTRDPIYNFCVMGGFANFDHAGKLLTVSGLAQGDGLRFDPPREFSAEVELALQQRGGLQPVTAAHLRNTRERAHLFAWIGPRDPVLPTDNGCFAYVCGGPEFRLPVRRLYFPVLCIGDQLYSEIQEQWKLAMPVVPKGECRVCMEQRPLVILQPCKHRALCEVCTSQLKKCPICRQTITGQDVCFDA